MYRRFFALEHGAAGEETHFIDGRFNLLREELMRPSIKRRDEPVNKMFTVLRSWFVMAAYVGCPVPATDSRSPMAMGAGLGGRTTG